MLRADLRASLMLRTAAVLLLLVAAFFGWIFHERYWRWRGCFNDLGRCWDPVGEQVYVAEAGMVWGMLASVPLLAGVILLLLARR